MENVKRFTLDKVKSWDNFVRNGQDLPQDQAIRLLADYDALHQRCEQAELEVIDMRKGRDYQEHRAEQAEARVKWLEHFRQNVSNGWLKSRLYNEWLAADPTQDTGKEGKKDE